MGISIHPPRAGRDTVGLLSVKRQGPFQSTRPVRGGTPARSLGFPFSAISIHPPRAGRDRRIIALLHAVIISIHPPHAGRDYAGTADCHVIGISIHPPRAGRDSDSGFLLLSSIRFQSTRPVRGGTLTIPKLSSHFRISIHPPRAGRDQAGAAGCPGAASISIHPPHAGRDGNCPQTDSNHQISIHPPHAGRDVTQSLKNRSIKDFNPPAPCGAGRSCVIFLFLAQYISIHPPHAGRDNSQMIGKKATILFQSTRPMRGGTPCRNLQPYMGDFNPPAPCGAGLPPSWTLSWIRYFNPPAPCGAGRCIPF